MIYSVVLQDRCKTVHQFPVMDVIIKSFGGIIYSYKFIAKRLKYKTFLNISKKETFVQSLKIEKKSKLLKYILPLYILSFIIS